MLIQSWTGNYIVHRLPGLLGLFIRSQTKNKPREGLFYLSFQLFLLLLFFLRVSHSTGWPQTSYIAKDGLELFIFLPLPPPCLDDSGWVPPCLACGTKPRAPCVLGEHCPRRASVVLGWGCHRVQVTLNAASSRLSVWSTGIRLC